MEIDKKPDVFDHPEFCEGGFGNNPCRFLSEDFPTCLLFKGKESTYTGLFLNSGREYLEKCDECKALYRSAKWIEDNYVTGTGLTQPTRFIKREG